MSATLLLADDSVTIQRVIELTFANEDVRVVAVSDGQAALKQIDAERPDIVLADVSMPKMDGYGVASHVKHSPSLKGIPVLLLTGAFEPVDEEKARASGCNGVLVKPFEPQQLIGRVKELLAGPSAAKSAETQRVEPAPFTAFHPSGASGPEPAFPVTLPAQPPVTVDLPRRSFAEPGPITPTQSGDDVFDVGFDQLDAALAQLEPTATPPSADRLAGSEFARDLDMFRNTSEGVEPPVSNRASFGDWDIPRRPPQQAAPPESSARMAEPTAAPPKTGEPNAAAPAPVREDVKSSLAPPDPQETVSIASAFSALLAAEQAQPPARFSQPSPAMSEATIEEMVRRVLVRMTDETVRKIVLDTAERLIREEIERIKVSPD